MTRNLGLDTMCVDTLRVYTWLGLNQLAVLVVSRYIYDGCDVCWDVAHRLVCSQSTALPSLRFDESLLLRNVVKTVATDASDQDVYIGRSETAMWIRVVSSWICMLLYIWSLIAPVVVADRCVNVSCHPVLASQLSRAQ
jgi:Serine incorporator (Serinc)